MLLEEVALVRHGVVPRCVVTREDRLEEREPQVLDEASQKYRVLLMGSERRICWPTDAPVSAHRLL